MTEHDDIFRIVAKPETEIHAEEQKKHEYRVVQSIILRKGLKLWRFNYISWELIEIDLQREVMVDMHLQPVKKSKAFHEPDCIYFQAINQKNAERKARNWMYAVKAKMEAGDGA